MKLNNLKGILSSKKVYLTSSTSVKLNMIFEGTSVDNYSYDNMYKEYGDYKVVDICANGFYDEIIVTIEYAKEYL